ncbi:hypothetical protein GH741_07355 [Aquibacillus halophilus]|uniref:Uncharacterized protein n=1 Tax=Aquibacillus halophilus TaxID=930132 RepID=A0A6A8DB22_9BACI|nr:hypothetical protein [Aquibacillus halophilus]MRH42500.1 hypothetical protein [Aquibacillus halophilus]
MKKYWKIISIVVIIVLSLGTFYVNAALSAEQYPGFVIETKSGDANEIKPLVLEGSYTDTSSMNYVSANLKITAEGSTYKSYSFLDQLIGQPPEMISELQDEYRNFMRGKMGSINSFFEDDQHLAYADVDYKMGSLSSSDFKLDISLLNKGDGNINEFTVKVPDSAELEYMYVDDVQMIGNELTLITQNMIRSNDVGYDEKHIYTVNLADQTIINHESLYQFSQGQGNVHTNVQLIGTSPTKAYEHIILLKTEEEIIEEMESSRVEYMNQEIISYNLATKEKENIDVPELNLKENQLSFFDGSTLYFTKLEGQELVVTPYNLEDDQVGNALSLQFPGEKDNVQVPVITVNNGKLFAVAPQMNNESDASVSVADVNTGETLFEGKIVLKDSSQEMGRYEIYLHEIFLK